jgi:hypothetical protein
MASTSNAKAVEAIFVSTARNDRTIISSELGRVSHADALVAVTNAGTAVGVLVTDRIATLDLWRLSQADALVAVANAGTAVRIFVANGISRFDKAC